MQIKTKEDKNQPQIRPQQQVFNENVKEGLAVAAYSIPLVICLLLTLAGIFLLLNHCYTFLKVGVWNSGSILSSVYYFFNNTSLTKWLAAPSSWLGLHKIIYGFFEWCPLWLFLTLAGPILAFIFFMFMYFIGKLFHKANIPV